MNIDQYMNRLDMSASNQISLIYLTELQYHHVTRIPFENLDVVEGIPLSLHIPEIYNKIVTMRRGGVCYELNGLYNALLQQLGYKAHLVAATVYREGIWGPTGTHATNLVHLDNVEYLIDVGFGGNSPRKPVPLTGEEILDVDGYYRISRDTMGNGLFMLEKQENGGWNYLYRFSRDKRNLEDFTEVCNRTQYSPDSIFNKKVFLTKVTDQGRITLLGNTFTEVNGLDKRKVTVKQTQMKEMMSQFFMV